MPVPQTRALLRRDDERERTVARTSRRVRAHAGHMDRRTTASNGSAGTVGGDEARPITLTSHRCASLGEIDGLLRRLDPDHETRGTDQLGYQKRRIAAT